MNNDHGRASSETRRKGSSSASSSGNKRGGGGGGGGVGGIEASENVRIDGPTPPSGGLGGGGAPALAPCGACKFLRRKCISGCVFAPHFGSDQGAARFAAVHKVFGASNVSKLLLHIPENRRNDAMVTISYEAQARLADPVYGCVSTILDLQQQVASLQAELALVQTQLMNSRYAVANAIQDSHAIQQQHHQIAASLQPAYSNTSFASNNLMNINSCNTSNFDLGAASASASGDATATAAAAATAPSYSIFDPVHLTHHAPQDQVEEDDEEESQNPLHHFTN